MLTSTRGRASALIAITLVASAGLMTASVQADEKQSTLYERLGGTYGIAQTVDYLVDQIYVSQALRVNPILKAIHEDSSTKAGFKVMVTDWVAQETGGPKIYQPDSLGHGKALKEMHAALNINDREFDVIETLCLTAFYRFNVANSDIDALMADLESYRAVIVTNKTEEPFHSHIKAK
jgi:hemoglobin